MVAVGDRYRGDTDIDQIELKKMEITALSTSQVADRIIKKEAVDQTIEAEAVRQQMMETEAILNGSPGLPVSARDPHDLHLQVLMPDLGKGILGAAKNPDPKFMDALNAGITHAEAHVQMWEEAGAPKEAVKPYIDAIKQADDALNKIAKAMAEQQQQQAQQAPQAGVPVDPNAPPQMGPDGQPMPPPATPEPIHPEEHMLKITSSIDYKTAPWSIRRQIEAAAGFQPATDEEDKQYQASQAVGKHPDKLAEVPAEPPSPAPPLSPPEPVA